jgi:hypothetical protein
VIGSTSATKLIPPENTVKCSLYARRGGKIGDLIAILIHVATGSLSGAVILKAGQSDLQLVSFNSLQYRPDERRFVMRSPDIVQPPWLTAASPLA